MDKKICGLVLIKDVDHNFSTSFEKYFSYLQRTIFSFLKIPSSSFINVVLCNKKKSRKLNSKFRQKNIATDVLSCNYQDKNNIFKDFPWGEIIICFEICQQQALINKWSFEIEFIRLLVHGLVHLDGYKHNKLQEETKMLTLEKKILNGCQLNFIYS